MLAGKYPNFSFSQLQSIAVTEVALVYKHFIIHSKKPEAIITVHMYIHSNCLSGLSMGLFFKLNSLFCNLRQLCRIYNIDDGELIEGQTVLNYSCTAPFYTLSPLDQLHG